MMEQKFCDFICKFFIGDCIGDRGLPASKSWMLIGVLGPETGRGCWGILCGACVLLLNWCTGYFGVRMRLN